MKLKALAAMIALGLAMKSEEKKYLKVIADIFYDLRAALSGKKMMHRGRRFILMLSAGILSLFSLLFAITSNRLAGIIILTNIAAMISLERGL